MAIFVSNIALVGALYELTILVAIAAALLDGVEGIGNLGAGIMRRIAQVWRGSAIPIVGDEDIGWDKVAGALKLARIYGAGVLAVHLVWCAIIWEGYQLGHPIAFGMRVGVLLLYLAAVVWVGYKDIPMSPPMKQAVHAGLIGGVVLLVLQAFGLFDWMGLRVPNNLNWNGITPWYFIGAAILLMVSGIFKMSVTTKPVGSLAKFGAVVLLFLAIWPTYKRIKDTPADTVLPKWAARPLVAVGTGVTTAIESAADSVTPAGTGPKMPLLATSGFNFEAGNCDPVEGKLDVYWVTRQDVLPEECQNASFGCEATPLEKETSLSPRGEAGFTKKLTNLSAPPGHYLYVNLKADDRYTWIVDASGPVKYYKRHPRFTTAADPYRDWRPLGGNDVDGYWLLMSGCSDQEASTVVERTVPHETHS
ncbi:MAG: hypothetical protein U0517_01720 [Candidatus Andersenbacteria bacterium]